MEFPFFSWPCLLLPSSTTDARCSQPLFSQFDLNFHLKCENSIILTSHQYFSSLCYWDQNCLLSHRYVLHTGDVLACFIFSSQWEATARLDFLWRLQAQQEVADMRELREHNECLLYNILPVHVAQHFLDRSKHDEVTERPWNLWSHFSWQTIRFTTVSSVLIGLINRSL